MREYGLATFEYFCEGAKIYSTDIGTLRNMQKYLAANAKCIFDNEKMDYGEFTVTLPNAQFPKHQIRDLCTSFLCIKGWEPYVKNLTMSKFYFRKRFDY